jgi:hypothetical protein
MFISQEDRSKSEHIPCIKVLIVSAKTDEVGVFDLDEDSGPKQVTTFSPNSSGAKDASR